MEITCSASGQDLNYDIGNAIKIFYKTLPLILIKRTMQGNKAGKHIQNWMNRCIFSSFVTIFDKRVGTSE
jgi:hypothetical protein